jgi:hypothetical protein
MRAKASIVECAAGLQRWKRRSIMLNRRGLIASAILGQMLAAAGSQAQDQAIVGLQTVTTYSADARITAVDASARTVTVTYPDGSQRTHAVGPTVANFGATRIGDLVSIAFEERMSFVLSGRNTPTPTNRDVSAMGTATAGQNLVGVSASQAVGTWWVVGVNPAANTITLVNPASGPVRTYSVTSQAGRDQLPRVQVGDSLTAINSQLMAVAITPKA